MRMELYHVEITRSGRLVTGYVVAPGEERAAEIVVEHELAVNEENDGFILKRIDETLPANQRSGLDALLETAPVGIASYCHPIGWVAHALPAPKLHLYRISELQGDDHYIIAPTGDFAIAVYCECVGQEDDEPRLFRILDGLIGLKNECLKGLPALLEFGPIGIVHWTDGHGWSMD